MSRSIRWRTPKVLRAVLIVFLGTIMPHLERLFSASLQICSNKLLNSAFERALSAEILASEQMRIRVLAATLALLLVLDQLLLFFLPEALQHLIRQPIPTWLPLQAIGPFLVYEIIALRALRYRISHGKDMPTTARFGNALIEISLPTLILWWINKYTSPAMAFGAWPSMLYFIFIAASTLRLDFALSVFTGAMAACEYLVLAYAVLPLDAELGTPALVPLYHLTRAVIMLLAGVVTGLVALRLRSKFRSAMIEAASRERVTNLFGHRSLRQSWNGCSKAPRNSRVRRARSA